MSRVGDHQTLYKVHVSRNRAFSCPTLIMSSSKTCIYLGPKSLSLNFRAHPPLRWKLPREALVRESDPAGSYRTHLLPSKSTESAPKRSLFHVLVLP